MAVDLTVAPGDVSSTYRRQVAQYTGPASYTTGGESGLAAQVRMGKLFAVLGSISDGSAVRLAQYDPATDKLLFFVPNTGAQVANAVDLSTFSGRLEFVGQ